MFIADEKYFLKNWKGLNTKEIKQREDNKQNNIISIKIEKSIPDILKENILTPFNLLNIVLFILVLIAGSAINGLFVSIVFINTIITTVKEISVKKKLDKIRLLNQSKITVIRNGRIEKITQDKVVVDDLIIFYPGEQIIIDGIVIDGIAFVNEGLITGESSLINKKKNSEVHSGSYIVSGKILVKTIKVGNDTYINNISLQAKEYKNTNSELMLSINKIIKYISFFILPLGGILILRQLFFSNTNWNEAVINCVAAIVGMIPEGLVLLTFLALLSANIKLTKYNALVQDTYAVENLARVDTICVDKTGTLTEGKLKFNKLITDVKFKEEYVKEALINLINILPTPNATQLALLEQFKEKKKKWEVKKIIPFISENKWSLVSFKDYGTWILGAPDILFESFEHKMNKEIKDQTENGNRCLALAYSDETPDDNHLPNNIKLAAIIVLSDILKKNAKQTIKELLDDEIEIKIISGDVSSTLRSIAIKLGLKEKLNIIDGYNLTLDKKNNNNTILKYNIFGRIVPDQKKDIIEALQYHGKNVAMIGDGVNDVLALKKSDCSLGMFNGSEIVRSVSQIVLMDSDFSSIPKIIKEGRKIIKNIQNVASLYLVKTIYSILLTVFFIFLNQPYAFMPIHLTIISTLMTGIPTFFMAFLSNNNNKIKGNFLKNILHSSMPGALSITICVIFLYLFIFPITSLNYIEKSTILFSFLGFMHFIILINLIMKNKNDNTKKDMIIIILLSIIMMYIFIYILQYQKLYKVLKITNFLNCDIFPLLIYILTFGVFVLIIFNQIFKNK